MATCEILPADLVVGLLELGVREMRQMRSYIVIIPHSRIAKYSPSRQSLFSPIIQIQHGWSRSQRERFCGLSRSRWSSSPLLFRGSHSFTEEMDMSLLACFSIFSGFNVA